VFDKQRFEELGVRLDKHGELPDLVVHMPTAGGWCSWRRRRRHAEVSSRT
jgi:hypothetical protein